MKRILVYVVATASLMFGGSLSLQILSKDKPQTVCLEDQSCWDCNKMGNKVCGNPADQSWEGLTGDQQQMLLATGEAGRYLDELVVDFRKVTEDNPSWNVWVEKDSDGLWSIYGSN